MYNADFNDLCVTLKKYGSLTRQDDEIQDITLVILSSRGRDVDGLVVNRLR